MADEQPTQKSAFKAAAIKFLILMAIAAAFVGSLYLGRQRGRKHKDDFARCLTDKKAVMYGLFWCPHCKEQEDLFGTSFEHLTYIECGTLDHKEQERCVKDGIKNFPTWQFADGQRHEGPLGLQELGAKTGCAAP